MSCIVFCFMCFCLVYSHRILVVVLEGGVVRPLDTPLLVVLDLLPASKRTLREVLVEAVVDVIEQRLADARVGDAKDHDEVGWVPLTLDAGGDVVLAGLLRGGKQTPLHVEWGGHVAVERVELLGGHLEGGEGGHLVLDDLGIPESQCGHLSIFIAIKNGLSPLYGLCVLFFFCSFLFSWHPSWPSWGHSGRQAPLPSCSRPLRPHSRRPRTRHPRWPVGRDLLPSSR